MSIRVVIALVLLVGLARPGAAQVEFGGGVEIVGGLIIKGFSGTGDIKPVAK